MNRPASFSVDFNGARGDLDAKVQCPSGDIEDAIITEIGQGTTKYKTVTTVFILNKNDSIFTKMIRNFIKGLSSF